MYDLIHMYGLDSKKKLGILYSANSSVAQEMDKLFSKIAAVDLTGFVSKVKGAVLNYRLID